MVTPVRKSLIEADISYLLHPFTNPGVHEKCGPLIIERGDGVYVYDTRGRRYLESFAGLCCVGLGWGEQRLVDAAAEQMSKLAYGQTFAHRSNPPAIRLAERLVEIAPVPMSKVFFANSGSEANDTAVKLIQFYNTGRGRPEKRKIISQKYSYHGTTVISGGMTGLDYVHAGFAAPPPDLLYVDAPHHYHGAASDESEEMFATRLAAQLDRLIVSEGPETVAAFFAEPVIGAGGMIVPPRTYFEKVQPVLRKHDVLFVADEVICGFGRTGAMFGCETFGLEPDALILGKQMSSAYAPISAVLLNEEVYGGIVQAGDRLGILATGFTCSGHPVSAAVALETLAIYEERQLISHAARVGEYLQRRLAELADHALVGDVRGIGMMAGVELVNDKTSRSHFAPESLVREQCARFAAERGLLMRFLINDTISLAPPLIITEEQVDSMVEMLHGALDETARWVSDTKPD